MTRTLERIKASVGKDYDRNIGLNLNNNDYKKEKINDGEVD